MKKSKIKKLVCWKIESIGNSQVTKYAIGINGPHCIVQVETYREAQFITKAINDRIAKEQLNPYTWKKDNEKASN